MSSRGGRWRALSGATSAQVLEQQPDVSAERAGGEHCEELMQARPMGQRTGDGERGEDQMEGEVGRCGHVPFKHQLLALADRYEQGQQAKNQVRFA